MPEERKFRSPSFNRRPSHSGASAYATTRPTGRGDFRRPTTNAGGSYGGSSSYRPTGGARKARPIQRMNNLSRFINKPVAITEVVEHYKPDHTFKDFEINESLKANIISKGYNLPTPIQDKTIPHILKGKDVVGLANTGTGKTAAFLIPLINKVMANPKEKILIMAPTRELAIQIDQELKGFTRGVRVYSVCCVGGAPIGKQISSLRYLNNFIIGTPGRLKDLIERKALSLNNTSTVVLDEADRMLDMGFINDMKFMMAMMPADRHTLFFSATLSPEIEGLINQFLKDPVRISVKTGDTSANVEQDVVRINKGENKVDVLHNLLTKEEFDKVLIFGRTKHGVEKLSKTLISMGLKAESIHGDKNHASRQRVLRMSKEDQVQVLVATDVAARGLDIPNVSHVINFDLPASDEDYVHRIGRTGRGNKKGKALTFID
jgi:superfamily II DNA/RNA helicase